MCAVVLQEQDLLIPDWVKDLDAFNRWVESDEFPEEGRICYLQGEVWVDMSTEQVFTHNQLKAEYSFAIMGLAKAKRSGRYFPDGLRLTHDGVDISVVPDGIFVTTASLRTGRVRLVEGVEGGFVRLEGSADMTLEVVSDSSVRKDYERLRQLYWEAGVREYWLVDAREDPPVFEIFRHTPKGYVATRKQAGWLKSAVLGASFRLSREVDELGHPVFTLAVR